MISDYYFEAVASTRALSGIPDYKPRAVQYEASMTPGAARSARSNPPPLLLDTLERTRAILNRATPYSREEAQVIRRTVSAIAFRLYALFTLNLSDSANW